MIGHNDAASNIRFAFESTALSFTQTKAFAPGRIFVGRS